jgi:hypothetical protein
MIVTEEEVERLQREIGEKLELIPEHTRPSISAVDVLVNSTNVKLDWYVISIDDDVYVS